MAKLKSSWSDAIWRALVSVRLTISLLICLTAISVAGTLIAQQGTTQVPLDKLYTPGQLKFLMALGLTDIFHSGFFIFLMLMLALNLLSCSFERLPQVWRQAFRVPPPPVNDPTLKEWTVEHARKQKFLVERPGFSGFDSVREAKMAAMLFFQKHFKHYVVLRDREGEFQLMVEKGKYSRVGVYITHLSLLMVMFGGVTGALFGFEGSISIEEGGRVSWMQHLKGTNDGMPLIRENGAPVFGFLNLGFEIECENFTLETWDGERPKLFKSVLNFYENDVLVHKAEVAVNHPTAYKGITFYQASYSEVGTGGVALKVFRMGKPGREPSQQKANAKASAPSLLKGAPFPQVESVELVDEVKLGELYRVDGNAAFKVLQVEPNLMDLGPAAKLQYFANRSVKKPTEFWIFKNLPGFDFAHRRDSGLNFVLEGVQPKYATGLSVAKDPGVWIVWIGCSIMVLALFLALYTCHSRYWITFTKEQGFVVVGWSNKLFLFEPRFEKFYSSFRKELRS
ncbi:MAG: cytochrome c biogenesis protein ResB [Bdellovibrionota bacterium]